MRNHALHLAVDIHDRSIPASYCVNSDQTRYTYSKPRVSTYDPIGMNQVAIVGKEDKRAFTIMVGVSMSGKTLPFQVMYGGKTDGSLPKINDPTSKFADANTEAKKLHFHFESTGIQGNHWSNLGTMKSYVQNVLNVYFDKQRALLKQKKTGVRLDDRLLVGSSFTGVP